MIFSLVMKKNRKGKGLVNKLIDLLPVELHLPGGYRYCGPGTKLEERLKRGDPGINKLDDYCKDHDISYSKTSDSLDRNKADLLLADRAWERVKAKDSSLAEKVAAYAVTNTMKLKAKLGMGCGGSKKKKTGKGLHRRVKKKKVVRKISRKTKKPGNISTATRIIPVPQTGSGLKKLLASRMGLNPAAVSTAFTKIGRIINNKNQKHTHIGKGLYVTPFKKGYGMYLKPPSFRLN